MMQFPIINQPQVAILSTDGIRRRPVVVTAEDGSEAIAIHSVGVLALAWDHRAFDGAYVAAFLDHVRSIIETRDWRAEMTNPYIRMSGGEVIETRDRRAEMT